MSKRKRSRAGKLVLEQLDIPGKTGPVSDSPPVWGINIAAALGNFPRQGLLCRAGPWTPMTQGDLVTVNWPQGVEVLQKVVGPGEENTTLQMFIPSTQIDEGFAEASYSVKRVGQAWEPSEDIRVLVKLTRPGGHDDNASPGHSKLIFSIPPDIINGGIDKDNIAAGVPITIERYPNIAVGDLIQVTWGGQFVLSNPLTQDQVDGKVPIVVHVSEAVIREAGDSDGRGVDVAFEVYDIVDNRSEDWSAPQWVVVAADATRILAPMLKEALNNILDLDTLGDRPGKAQIWAIPPGFEVGDTVILIIKGTPLEGPPISIEISGKPLQNVPSTDEIEVPNALLRQLAKTQLAMRYRLIKANGNPDLHSKTQFIRVDGEPQRLAPPIALDAVQGALDPELTTVDIKILWDDSFAAGQAIKTIWLGTAADLTTYMPTLSPRLITNGDVEAKKPLKISVEGKHLSPIIGGILELYYLLLIDDSVLGTMNCVNATHAVRESEHADILRVGEPRLELPEPEVAGVVDGALPADTDGTTLTVNYLKTAEGDVVIYEWHAPKISDSDSVKLSSHTAGQPVSFNIKAQFIKENEGDEVSARYSIERHAGGTSYSNPLVFNIDSGFATPEITSVKDLNGKEVPNGNFIAGDYVILTGNATKSLNVEIFNRATSLGNAKVNASGLWTRRVSDLTIGLNSLTVKGLYGGNPISAARFFTVALIPTIEFVKDSKGIDITNNGFTVDTRATLSGKAHGNQEVEIFNGTHSEGKTSVSPDGSWSHTLTNLAQKVHNLTANALNGSGYISSPWSFTVTAELEPSFTSIKDSNGVDVPHRGSTVDTSVNLTGIAAKRQVVNVRDNTESKGRPIADPVTGIWNLVVSDLSLGTHDFTVKAEYGGELESPAWSLTVLKGVSGSEDFERAQVGIIPYNVQITLPSGLKYIFTELQPHAHRPGIANDPLPEVRKYLYTGSPVMSRYDLGGVAKRVKFIYRHSNATENRVIFYDNTGTVIHSQFLQQNTWLTPKTVDFQTDKNCAYFTLRTVNHSGVAGIGVTDITWYQ